MICKKCGFPLMKKYQEKLDAVDIPTEEDEEGI
jgi:hypothetical protein